MGARAPPVEPPGHPAREREPSRRAGWRPVRLGV